MILADGKLIALGEAGCSGCSNRIPTSLEEIARWQVPQMRYLRWVSRVLKNKTLPLPRDDHSFATTCRSSRSCSGGL